MRASHEIARQLATRGHDLHVCGYGFDAERIDLYGVPLESDNGLDFSAFATRHDLLDPRPNHLRVDGLGWRIGKLVRNLQRLRDLQRFNEEAAIAAAEIDALDCDVVLLHLCCFTNAPLVMRHMKTRSVWYCHEPSRNLFDTAGLILDKGKDLGERLYRRKRRIAEIRAAEAADLIVCNSDFSREAIIRAYGLEARVCRLGVNSVTFTPSKDCIRRNQVICWGPLWPSKGLDFVVRSVARIPASERPKVVLPWTRGSEAYCAQLRESASSLGVDIDTPRGLTDKELLHVLHESKVCVYAPRMEPFGLVPVEAMAAGLPVIGIREGGVRETVVHGVTGFLTERHEDEFAGKLRELLNDDVLREKMGFAAQDYVRRKWSWDRTVDQVERCIRPIE